MVVGGERDHFVIAEYCDVRARSAFGFHGPPAVAKAGLPSGTGFHALRAAYASLLIRHGESVKTVQSRLGHKSESETLDTYSHLWPDSDDLDAGRRRAGSSGLRANCLRTPARSTNYPAGHRLTGDEAACKPGSVPGRLAAFPFGDHPSRRAVAGTLHAVHPQARAGSPQSPAHVRRTGRFSTLLRVGFTEPPRSPGALVVSYTTVSPLPTARGPPAVCFLWHCPAARAGLPLTTTLPCGARTFLGTRRSSVG